MKSKNSFTLSTIAAGIISAGTGLSTLSNAEEMIEEVVSIGSRIKARSVTETPAPVDVITASELANQGDTDISNLLRNSVPSYAVNDQPISDAATLVRPANLRGMAPDHTLLLVNGKRRHRASVITWLGNGISNGSQGPDTSSIPAMALKSVEVLRDGASSIYGSDAIAGVINFQLKDASDGNTIELRAGEYSAGDGRQLTLAMNKGVKLGADGFVNMTLEYGSSEATSRSEQRADARGLIENGITDVPSPAQVWGRPIVDDDMKFFVNFGADLGAGTEMYGYTNYNSKTVDGGFFYRNPHTRNGVYSRTNNFNTPDNKDDDFKELLVADLTADGSGDCSKYVVKSDDPTSQALSTALTGLKADDKCYHFSETIPGGFTPRFGGNITDQAFLFGLKGEADGGLGWDVSTYYGRNKSDFHINNTVNASLGPQTPRDFDPGYYQQVDMNLNADFNYSTSDRLNWAFGAEYRVEEFTIGAGQEESFIDGGLGGQGFSTSSNGFPGFPAKTAGTFERSNLAAYVEADWDVSDDFLIQTAFRFEDFEDFGATSNYKLGLNYAMSDGVGIRGTFSTGFKAPTPGQSNASNTSTELTGGVLVNNGTIPATSAVALSQGSKPLQPEEAVNFTFGVYATLGELDITFDYFKIRVDDRLNLSKETNLEPDDIKILKEEGVTGAGDLTKFRFFTNDFSTDTSGYDIVISTSTGNTDWNLAYNHTRTDVTEYNPDTIDTKRIRQIEETTPDTRWNLSANHSLNNLRLLARVSYYSEWFDSFEYEEFGTEDLFDGEYILDVMMEYDFNDKSTVVIGGNNILDNAGQKATDVNNIGSNSALEYGNTYSQYAPMGVSGAFWYATYRYNF